MGALFKMPYGYYELMRMVVTIGFIALVIIDANKRWLTTPIQAIGAMVFNPVIKLPFNRGQWHIIDIITIFVLALMIFSDIYHVSFKKKII